MPFPIVDGLIKETKGHPYTMLLLVALCFAVPYLYTHTASADELRNVQQQIAQTNINITRSALETQLKATQTELFSLTREVSDRTTSHKPVDPIYYARINDLQIQKAELERKLANLK